MFYVSLREKPEISSVVAAISKIKLQEFESKKIEPFQEISYYKDEIKKRDIFNVFEEEKPAPVEAAQPIVKAPEPPPVPVVPIEQKAKNIKLVGISWGDNPKVIIRDTSTQNVQFFGVGETIDGTDIKVEKILKNEVILSSEGQEMSLL
jgi:type II secretory pathway component PulC